MDAETLRTLITCGTTVLVALISNILVFAVTMINNNTNKKNSISEEQYKKIFAPIHKILYFDEIYNDELKYKTIKQVIDNNYHLVPKNIRESFLDIELEKIECDEYDYKMFHFQNKILICYAYLGSVLGYSKTKLSRGEMKYAKSIINHKSIDFIESKRLKIFAVSWISAEILVGLFLRFYCGIEFPNNYFVVIITFVAVALSPFVLLFIFFKIYDIIN